MAGGVALKNLVASGGGRPWRLRASRLHEARMASGGQKIMKTAGVDRIRRRPVETMAGSASHHHDGGPTAD
jgi:hypothetical protein